MTRAFHQELFPFSMIECARGGEVEPMKPPGLVGHRVGIDLGNQFDPTAIAVLRKPLLTAAPWEVVHYEEFTIPTEPKIHRVIQVAEGYPGAVAIDPGPREPSNEIPLRGKPRIVRLTRDLKRTWLFMLRDALIDRQFLIPEDPSMEPLIESLRSIRLDEDPILSHQLTPRSITGNDHGVIALALAWLLIRRPSISDRNR